MKILLDTNVVSEARRPDGNPSVRAMLSATANEDQFISVISLGEIAYGIARLKSGKRRRDLEDWVAQLERDFSDHLLPVDRHISHLWGDLAARCDKTGRPISAPDGLIAATAIHHGLRLITRNTTDFEATGVMLIDPWQA